HRGAVGAHLDCHRSLHPQIPRPRGVPCGPQCAQRAAERGGRVPHRFRSLRAAPAGVVVRHQPGAAAPLAGEGHLGAAAGAFRRGGLVRTARRLPRELCPARAAGALERTGRSLAIRLSARRLSRRSGHLRRVSVARSERPRLAVIVETELWPNLYRECARRRVPLVLASARLSARSVGRYRRLGALFRDTLSQAAVVAAQGAVDAERFHALGADPASTHVTGNLKFDFQLPPRTVERGAQLREQYSHARALWVAGSTHGGGEEQALLEAQRRVRALHPEARLVLAPRHPQRFAEVAALLHQAGASFVRRSQGAAAAAQTCEVLLLDSLGELLD